MSLMRNLIFAEMAVKFAERHLRGGASNRPEDIAHALQRHLFAQRNGDREAILEELHNDFACNNKMMEIRTQRVCDINDAREARTANGNRLNAASIIADGIGNCFEHSVLACHFLRTQGVACYMVETDWETNHVFVVIGVNGGLDGQTFDTPTRADPGLPLSTPESVVCDPWYHEWFGIRDSWATKMGHILSITTKGDVAPIQVPLTFMDGAQVQ